MIGRATLAERPEGKRRSRVWGWALVVLVLAATTACSEKSTVVRIGYQKYGILLWLKEQGSLEKALGSRATIQWAEFPSGPPMMEAFHASTIDFGVAGEAPPVFAQANGAPIVYVAADPPAPSAEAILVHANSPLHAVAELRGKTVALNRGSNVHYFLAAALASAGVPYDAVNLKFLPPTDARAAFDSGAVDAWVIWDPFLSNVLRTSDARVLRDGSGIAQNVPYYLSTSTFAGAHPELVRSIVAEIKRADDYVASHPNEVAAFLAGKTGIQVEAMEDSLHRNRFDIGPITPDVAANQQRVADTFFELKLITHPLRISDIVSNILN
jgi:sulfonate transport system substrate-binding protein